MKKLLSVFVLLCAGCSELSINDRYQQAVLNASVVTDEKVAPLWVITPDNPQLQWNEDKSKVLVVTWKKRKDYESFLRDQSQTSDNLNYAIWVTAAPQVKQFCQEYAKQHTDEELNLRLKQYLGLAPDWQYEVFVELWVDPDVLFRPCVDGKISDKQCQAAIPKDFPKGHPEQVFYQDLYFKSFRKARVPWTGLGYTYDWGNHDTVVGASEFIIAPSSPYQIKQVQSTHDYCTAR